MSYFGSNDFIMQMMKFAIPVADGRLAAHFGHCEQFALIETENGEIKNSAMQTPPPHEPGVLPKWLHEQGANVIIAGGMGSRAQQLFGQSGIKVVGSGRRGDRDLGVPQRQHRLDQSCDSRRRFQVTNVCLDRSDQQRMLEVAILAKNCIEKVEVVETGCNGFCALGPLLVVHPGDILYEKLTVDDMPELVDSLVSGKPVKRLLYKDPVSKAKIAEQTKIPFFAHQMPRALRNKGLIDPESIDEYIGRDGYTGVAKALFDMTPDQIIEEMKRSGMRGRGGAGFPAHIKWRARSIR